VLTPPGMSVVVMLELDHEKVLANGAMASKMVPVETRHLVPYHRAGRGRRERRVEDCGMERVPTG